MIRTYIIPVLAIAGLVFAAYTVIRGNDAPRLPQVASRVPPSPFQTSVMGSGIVEPSTEYISVATQIPGVVTKIYVAIGDLVKTGDPLFSIDASALLAESASRKAVLEVEEGRLAAATYEVTLAEPLVRDGVGSEADLQRKRFAMKTAAAQLVLAQNQLKAIALDIERSITRAPVDGQVLQIKVHVGEFASTASTATGQTPFMLLGSVSPLHLRVDVDEYDAWRVKSGMKAIGYLRGNRLVSVPLTFVRFEPYVIPKKSLTGDSAERVDTRVMQVIFWFDRGDLPILVGQQMDVLMDALGHAH